MGILADFLTSQRTALAASPTSFTNVPAQMDIGDLPTSKNHKAFVLRVAGVPQLLSMHGGGTAEYLQDIELVVQWDPELDPEAIHNTVANDIENASHVMLKTSNRTSGIQLVLPAGGVIDQDTDMVRATLTYSVTYRVSQDMT